MYYPNTQCQQAGDNGLPGVLVQLLVEEADSRESEAVSEATPVLDEMLTSETVTLTIAPSVSSTGACKIAS